MARDDQQDLVLDIAKECDVGDATSAPGEQRRGVERELFAFVSEHECAALVRDGEDDDERSEHGLTAAGRVLVRLKERAFTCQEG